MVEPHTLPDAKRTPDGDFAVQQFKENYPTTDNVGHFYNNLSIEGYEEHGERVNYNEFNYIIDEVVRLASLPESGVTKYSEIFDVGAGTGLVG